MPKISAQGIKATAIGLAVFAGTAIVVYLVIKAAKAAGAVGEATKGIVNPGSRNNLVYRSINAVGGAAAQEEDWSLGSWLYDVTHPSESKPVNDWRVAK